MTDINATVERIKSANAVPSTDSFPTGAWSSSQLLVRIDERNETMTETLTPVRRLDPSRPPGRGRGPLIALAVAAALILILGVVGFNVLTGDEPDVIEPVPTTSIAPTTTTSAAPTTTDPLLEGLLPADTPPLEIVAAIRAEWLEGDIEGAEALVLPDSPFFTADVASGVAPEILYRVVTGMTTETECAIGTPAQLEPWSFRFASSAMVTCNDTLTSGLEPGVEVGGGTVAFEVAEGWIVDFIIVDYVGALQERNGLNAYRSWVQEFFPDDYATVFDATTLQIILDTDEARAQHAELVPFFVGDTGPRGELALPADTPLLDVVEEFTKRFDAGDLEGYEALIHPAGAGALLGVGQASWFADATGMTTERTCTLVAPTQVRCDEVATSGLVPGLVVAEYPSIWNGRAGWIWTVEIDDAREIDFANPATAPGVPEYRAWVQENEPDLFDTLFIGSINMRLDSAEIRTAHQEMIQRYLAATS